MYKIVQSIPVVRQIYQIFLTRKLNELLTQSYSKPEQALCEISKMLGIELSGPWPDNSEMDLLETLEKSEDLLDRKIAEVAYASHKRLIEIDIERDEYITREWKPGNLFN